MNRSSKTRGISRIDQAAKHNHGFFARLQRDGKIYSAFFADQAQGGRKKALVAARAYHQNMLEIFGPPMQKQRRWWAESPAQRIVRHCGVQSSAVRRGGKVRKYLGGDVESETVLAVRKMFSIKRHGFETPGRWPFAPAGPACAAWTEFQPATEPPDCGEPQFQGAFSASSAGLTGGPSFSRGCSCACHSSETRPFQQAVLSG